MNDSAAGRLIEQWRNTLPGHLAHVILCDPISQSLFVGDGWQVAYAALRLHKLDLNSGSQLAEIRTRHQGVTGMILHSGYLYAATDSRLFEMQISDLSIARQWERNLVKYTMQMVPAGTCLAVANWRSPSIGLFDISRGHMRRLKVGSQPLLFRYCNMTKAIAGFNGGMFTIDEQSGRLIKDIPTPPVSEVVAGTHIWAVLASAAQGGEGDPPIWIKRGSDHIIRLTGEPWSIQLPEGECYKLICDDINGILWCLTYQGDVTIPLRRRSKLLGISQKDGKVLASFSPETESAYFAYVDAVARVAITMQPSQVTGDNNSVPRTSKLICYSLPKL